jgi:hypothetical protein
MLKNVYAIIVQLVAAACLNLCNDAFQPLIEFTFVPHVGGWWNDVLLSSSHITRMLWDISQYVILFPQYHNIAAGKILHLGAMMASYTMNNHLSI